MSYSLRHGGTSGWRSFLRTNGDAAPQATAPDPCPCSSGESTRCCGAADCAIPLRVLPPRPLTFCLLCPDFFQQPHAALTLGALCRLSLAGRRQRRAHVSCWCLRARPPNNRRNTGNIYKTPNKLRLSNNMPRLNSSCAIGRPKRPVVKAGRRQVWYAAVRMCLVKGLLRVETDPVFCVLIDLIWQRWSYQGRSSHWESTLQHAAISRWADTCVVSR